MMCDERKTTARFSFIIHHSSFRVIRKRSPAGSSALEGCARRRLKDENFCRPTRRRLHLAAPTVSAPFSASGEDDIREGIRRIGEVIKEQVELYGTLTGERKAPQRQEPAEEPANVVPIRRRAAS